MISIDNIYSGLLWYVSFVVSTVFHEAAHASAAKVGGDTTSAAQLTLNPIPHIRREPFGMVVVPWLSFFLGGWMVGWASVPLDPGWAHRYPTRAGWMSLAGPTANLILCACAAAAMRGGIAAGLFEVSASGGFAELLRASSGSAVVGTFSVLLSVLFSLNLMLALFNLLPIPPLDGATVMNVFLGDDAARRWQSVIARPPAALVGLVIAWNLFPELFGPIYRWALAVVLRS